MNPVTTIATPALRSELAAVSLQQHAARSTPAPGKTRPVELRSHVVDPSEQGAAARSTSRSEEPEPRLVDERERDAENPPKQQEPAAAPARKALTYTLVDSLPPSVQVQVIDRATDKVIRAVPTDRQIAVRESLDAYVGRELDVYA